MQQTGLLTMAAALLLLTALPASSCRSDPASSLQSEFSGHVVIIGAGAAGLMAAAELEKGGYSYEVLEASGRIGGRLGKIIDFADSYARVGAGRKVRELASQPVDNRIFFAGEAMNRNGHASTVHGAMETGIEAVRAILASP